MIEHKIVITPEPVVIQHGRLIQPVVKRLNKYEYAVHLRELPFKKGDILVNKYMQECPKTENAFFRVEDIQEMHGLVDYEGEIPRPLLLKNKAGASFWSKATTWIIAPTNWLIDAGPRDWLVC